MRGENHQHVTSDWQLPHTRPKNPLSEKCPHRDSNLGSDRLVSVYTTLTTEHHEIEEEADTNTEEI